MAFVVQHRVFGNHGRENALQVAVGQPPRRAVWIHTSKQRTKLAIPRTKHAKAPNTFATVRVSKHLPNAITCGNLLAGCLGIVAALDGQLTKAGLCIIVAGLFDVFDGLVARLLKVSSPIGKDLDSLADMVSFGVLPSIIYFVLLRSSGPSRLWVPYLAFAVAVGAALRLAKFNNDTRQTSSFIGLPSPANALVATSFAFAFDKLGPQVFGEWMLLPFAPLFAALLSAGFMVSELPLFSFKLKSRQMAEVLPVTLLLLGGVVNLILFRELFLAPTILWYVLLGSALLLFGKHAQE